MKRFRQDRSQAMLDRGKLFVGDVYRQDMVTAEETPTLRVNPITFENGARNRWHYHSTEQVLVVTHGAGIVENERETFHVTPGDVVLIPAGERHWHGAEEGQSMTHLSILLPGELTPADEA